jgi:hypothetical protein
MWFDQWHLAGYLLDKFGFRAAYDSGISVGSKLSTIIRNGAWFWPYAQSNRILDIQRRLREVDIGIEDLPIWNSRNGSYSCVETWEQLRNKKPVVVWWKLVWFSAYSAAFLHPLVGRSRCNCH